MSTQPRYRSEEGVPCIDVNLTKIEQLFDNRDPAPFRERDLDPDLEEYLYDAAEDLHASKQLRIVFWIDEPAARGDEIEPAVRSHIGATIERNERNHRRRQRSRSIALVFALGLMAALVTLSQLLAARLSASLATVLREGLAISAWIVMWRPAEGLIYDWIPLRRERTIWKRLLAAPIDVRQKPR